MSQFRSNGRNNKYRLNVYNAYNTSASSNFSVKTLSQMFSQLKVAETVGYSCGL